MLGSEIPIFDSWNPDPMSLLSFPFIYHWGARPSSSRTLRFYFPHLKPNRLSWPKMSDDKVVEQNSESEVISEEQYVDTCFIVIYNPFLIRSCVEELRGSQRKGKG